MNARINDELPLAENSFHRLLYFAKATSARRIMRLAGAQSLTNEPRNFLGNARIPSLLDFIANMLLIETKTVTQRNRIVVDLKPDAYAQIINGELMAAFVFEIDNRTIARRAEAVASIHGPLQ